MVDIGREIINRGDVSISLPTHERYYTFWFKKPIVLLFLNKGYISVFDGDIKFHNSCDNEKRFIIVRKN